MPSPLEKAPPLRMGRFLCLRASLSRGRPEAIIASVADAERLAEALDWFEDALGVLKDHARALRAADEDRAAAAIRWQQVGRDLERRADRVEADEAALAVREQEVSARERGILEATAAHGELTKQLEARTAAFERRALEFEASLERLRAAEAAVAERAALLDQRALDVSDRAAQLDELARNLSERSEAVTAQGRDLERFAERIRQRDAELDRRDEELTEFRRRVTEQEIAAEHAAWVLRPVAVKKRSGTWTLPALKQLAEENAPANPARVDEWRAYLRYLRDFADVDGRLPSSFDSLIEDVFKPSSLVGRNAGRNDGA